MSYLGAFTAVRMYVRETGEDIDFWTGGDGKPVLPYVTSVTVDLNLGIHSQITIQMDIPYAEGIRLLSETPYFHRGNIVRVKLGYSFEADSTPFYTGLVVDPGVDISPNGVSVTLVAKGVGALATARCFTGSHNGTMLSWVEDFATRFGYELDVGAEANEALARETQFNGSGESFVQLLRVLLGKVKCVMWFDNDNDTGRATLHIRKRSEVTSGEPTKKFVMFGQPSKQNNEYPILSWSAPSKASLLSQGSAGVKSIYMNERGEIVELDKKEADSDENALGDGTLEGGQETEEDRESGQKIDKEVEDDEASLFMVNLPGNDDTADDDILARRDELFMGALGIEATVGSIGVTNLLPTDLVQVVGCSSRFDGLYMLFRVVHTVSTSGFETSWVGKRNAVTAAGSPPAEIPPNEQEVTA